MTIFVNEYLVHEQIGLTPYYYGILGALQIIRGEECSGIVLCMLSSRHIHNTYFVNIYYIYIYTRNPELLANSNFILQRQ